jgi:hypothetical protein
MHVLRRDDPPLRLADDDDYHGLHSAAGVAGLFSHDYESGCGTASPLLVASRILLKAPEEDVRSTIRVE